MVSVKGVSKIFFFLAGYCAGIYVSEPDPGEVILHWFGIYVSEADRDSVIVDRFWIDIGVIVGWRG